MTLIFSKLNKDGSHFKVDELFRDSILNGDIKSKVLFIFFVCSFKSTLFNMIETEIFSFRADANILYKVSEENFGSEAITM